MASTISTPSPKTLTDPAVLRQRQFLRSILLPVGLSALLIFGAGIFTLFGLRGQDASVVADIMLTCLCLFPTLLCLFPVYLVLVISVTVLSRADNFTTRQVRRVRTLTADVATRTYQTGDSLSRRSITFNARFAPFDRLFNLFDRLAASSEMTSPESQSPETTSSNGKTKADGKQ
jgi:hypothetical protein